MDNPWAPSEEGWRLKLFTGEPIDFTVDTPDRALFEEMGEERVQKCKILKHSGPLPHQGDLARCKILILLAHTNGDVYRLASLCPDELDSYFSNLLQRPLSDGEPVKGLSLSQDDREWWSERLEPWKSALIERGNSPEEAGRRLQDGIAVLQLHAYATEEGASSGQFEPACLKENSTMSYSLELARKAIERGAIVLPLVRWKHWDKVLELSAATTRLLRVKRLSWGIPKLERKIMDAEKSNVTFDDLLDALCEAQDREPAKKRTKKRKVASKIQTNAADKPEGATRDGPENNDKASRAAVPATAEAERRAKAEAEGAARLAAVEAARIAAEEEAKKRRLFTMEEAVEFAVRVRLAAERKAMEEEHAKREKKLLDRIAQLEAAQAKLPGDGVKQEPGAWLKTET